MYVRGRSIHEVGVADLQALLEEQVRESKQLDYKQELPGSATSDRKEFLKDVTALANTSGGVLLYGVTEKRDEKQKFGTPESFVGVAGGATEGDLGRLESIIRDNTDPPLTGCAVVPISMPGAGTVVGIGVPRSLLAPHAVALGSRTYWRRGTRGNYPVDTRELRQLFLERSEWDAEIERFRQSRIEWVRERRLIPNLDTDGSIVLHVLPLGRLNEQVDLIPHRDEFARVLFGDFYQMKRRVNLDGYLVQEAGAPDCKTFLQWFRSGGIEFYTSTFHKRPAEGAPLHLDASRMAVAVKKYTALAIRFLRRLRVDPPYVVLLSVFDVLGGSITTDLLPLNGHLLLREDTNLFDRDVILLPPLPIEDQRVELREALMPALDILWQAAGISRCFLDHIQKDW